MKGLKGILFVATIAFFTLNQQAYAVYVEGMGLYVSSNSGPNPVSGMTVTTSPGTGYGGALFLGSRLAPMFDLETGAIYLPENFSYNATGITGNTAANFLEIPLTLKFSPLRWFSVGAGGYYAFGMGTVNVAGTANMSGNNTMSDYGLAAVADFKIRIAPLMSFVLEGRYHYDLGSPTATVTSPSTTITPKFTDLIGMAGVRIGF